PCRDSEALNSIFDLISNASTVVEYSPDPKDYLAALKTQVLSDLSSQGKEKTKTATDFTLDEAIDMFGLKFEQSPDEFSQKHHWDIEKEMGMKEFPTTPCIAPLLNYYAKNFNRTSEALCRTAVNFMLNECLTVMKGLDITTADDARPKTPNPLHDIKIYGKVSFAHTIIPRPTMLPSHNIVVSGRVDHAIGRILKSRANIATEQRKRGFYSLLLLTEAKFHNSVDHAIPQLIVYRASLHQSRLQRNRTDASVYGLASDGYVFIFVKISHDGTVMRSRQFDILAGEMKKVLGCLQYVLEMTASRSPKSTPERFDDDKNEVDESDPPLNLDDTKFMTPPVSGRDEEDEVSSVD
ncbi:hypothetical protein L208DRAFT_1405029, partial [Tricholoma matsutake]